MAAKKETLKQRNAGIRKQNEAFEKLSAWRKRVVIAQDVIAQIEASRIRPVTGSYLELDERPYTSLETQLCTIFRKVETCTACALGSMFLCGVQLANKLKLKETRLKFGDTAGGDDVYSYLGRFFELGQLVLIESAFECRNMLNEQLEQTSNLEVLSEDDIEDIRNSVYEAVAFGLNLGETSENRLRLIMRNIIANRGEFIPSQVPYKGWITPNYND